MSERTLTRRGFLAATCCAGAMMASPFQVALAEARTERRLVLVILRGALDGLTALAPYGDPDYAAARGPLALPRPGGEGGLLDLDGYFGLHPSMATLHRWMRAGEATAFHAIATSYRERSHFDAQDLLENGTGLFRGARDGWLNRALRRLGPGDRRLGLALAVVTPLVLTGAAPVASWSPSLLPEASPDFLAFARRLYESDALFHGAFEEALELEGVVDGVMTAEREALKGTNRDRALKLAETAGAMLSAADGPRVAVLEIGGWDTHQHQARRLERGLEGLDQSLAALRRGLGGAWVETAAVVVTEFGRTVAMNGSNGTDHGSASAAFLVGGRVAGGGVRADWPGLSRGRLFEGRDLQPTADLRSLFKAALIDHLRLDPAVVEAEVFPDSADAAPMRGLFI